MIFLMQIFHCCTYNLKGGRRGKKLVLISQDLFLFYGLCDGDPQLPAAEK